MRSKHSFFKSILFLAFCSMIPISCTTTSSPNGPAAGATELEGTWAGHMSGDTSTYTFAFTQNSFALKSSYLPAGTDAYSGTFSTNTAANPKQVDSYVTQCPLNAAYIGKTSLGIYKISNDTLTYAGNEPGNTQRPASFAYDPTGATVVFVLKRQ